MSTETTFGAAGDGTAPLAASARAHRSGWIVLTSASGPRPSRPLPRTRRVVLQVSAAALVVLVLVGIAGG